MSATARPMSLALISAAFMFVHPIFLLPTILLLLDAKARWNEYLDLIDKPFSVRLANKLGRSWCGRGVAEALWCAKASTYYYEKGYRWWHILPDGAPMVFLNLDFWKKVLGISKKYW